MAADPSLANAKMIVSSSDSGSKWLIRAKDIVAAWDSGSAQRTSWVFIDHSKDKTRKERETRMFVSVRCNERTYRIQDEITYRADGTVLDSSSLGPSSYGYSNIVPETVMESVADTLCTEPPAAK